MPFYVIEFNYIGPNQFDDRNIDSSTIEIHTRPALTNMSKEERVLGWCGTTSDVSVYAHEEYDTLEQAREGLLRIHKHARDRDEYGNDLESDHEHAVEIYRPGKYIPMSASATGSWVFEALREDVSADTTDERIDELVSEYKSYAHGEGFELHSVLGSLMKERRQELLDEMGE